jgi:hypothetical protein
VNQPGSILNNLSIVIPTDVGEMAWKELLLDLRPLPPDAEILVVGVDEAPIEFRTTGNLELPRKACWLQSSRGRAKQMNHGATMANRPFLWFLHADSRLKTDAFEKMDVALR